MLSRTSTSSSPIVARQRKSGVVHYVVLKVDGVQKWERAGSERREAFITLARRGGAPKDIVERITHNAKGDIVDEYTTWDWEPLCKAVLCFPEIDAEIDGINISREIIVEAPGIEPGSEKNSLHASTYVAGALNHQANLPSARFPLGYSPV